MSPTDAAMDAVKRVAARYGNNKEELASIGINFYAVNKKGEYGAAGLWNGSLDEATKVLTPSKFAVHDGKEVKLVECAYLYERTR
jgi:hypothetical protein